MNNLIFEYELTKPGQNYPGVAHVIQSLGDAVRIHPSIWYVRSRFSAIEAGKALVAAVDANDSFVVIDATNNQYAQYRLAPEVVQHLARNWHRPAFAGLGARP